MMSGHTESSTRFQQSAKVFREFLLGEEKRREVFFELQTLSYFIYIETSATYSTRLHNSDLGGFFSALTTTSDVWRYISGFGER